MHCKSASIPSFLGVRLLARLGRKLPEFTLHADAGQSSRRSSRHLQQAVHSPTSRHSPELKGLAMVQGNPAGALLDLLSLVVRGGAAPAHALSSLL